MIKLRDYQNKQLDFIDDRVDLTNVLGIESPTGSGKTFVILEQAKRWLEKPENHLSNVIITTGFNNLVFLMEKRANEMKLKTKILIGTKACNCPKCMEEAGVEPKIFTETNEFLCKDKHKHLDTSTDIKENKTCPYTRDFYFSHYDKITNGVGQIIIMNHSSFLVHQQNLPNVSLVIVDEAHTFSSFYESFVQLELDRFDLFKIDKAINSIKSPMDMIIKMNIKKGVSLPQVQIDKMVDEINDKNLKVRAREFFETKPSPQNYIQTSPNQFTIDRFYRYFDFKVNTKFLLFSATLDKFTRMMFQCKDAYFYKEKRAFCDFTKSEFIAVPDEIYENSLVKFLDYVDSKGLESGLCLSTTVTDVNNTLKFDNYHGFKMFEANNVDEFEKFKGKKILVGSRRLFQGIDIDDLQFVSLNKIPFPNWDEKTQAMRDYLTNDGKNEIDFWSDYSVPKTENDIIQSTGRLWRSIESFGVISIFDHRIEKHKYIIRHVMNSYRYGIKTNIMYEDGKIDKFDVNKINEIDKSADNRKDISKGLLN